MSLPDLRDMPLPTFTRAAPLSAAGSVEMTRICLGPPASLTAGLGSADDLDMAERGVTVADVHPNGLGRVDLDADVEAGDVGAEDVEADGVSNISAEIERVWRLTDDLPDSDHGDLDGDPAVPAPR